MPFNGSGVYTAPAADFPVVTQTVISSTHFNNTINDIATALSTCLTKDGQQTATANIPFGGFRATNVGITAIAGSVGTPAINVSDTGTGLYRSAASELAVTVAGTQRARFDGTGLIVTGAASVSTTLTATTSVVTPLVGPTTAADLALQTNGTIRWLVSQAVGGGLVPNSDNAIALGLPANRISSVFTPIIDSGSVSALSLKTNNGTTQATIFHTPLADSPFTIAGGRVGVQNTIISAGGGNGIGLSLINNAASFNFYTGSAGLVETIKQFQVDHTAGANRNITVTGSNGGNPTLSTTAGSLAITPAVIIAGSSLSVDTSTTVALSGTLRFPSTGSVQARNAANTGDVSMVQMQTINSIADIVVIGSGGTGLVAVARSGGAAPTTTDLAAGRWTVWRDTGGATTKIYYNNAGAIIASAAFA